MSNLRLYETDLTRFEQDVGHEKAARLRLLPPNF